MNTLVLFKYAAYPSPNFRRFSVSSTRVVAAKETVAAAPRRARPSAEGRKRHPQPPTAECPSGISGG